MYPWNVEFGLDPHGELDQYYHIADFIISVLINIGSIIAATVMGYWYFVQLKSSKHMLRPLIGSVALAKANLWFASSVVMVSLVFRVDVHPLIHLFSGIVWVIVIYMQVDATIAIRPSNSDRIVADMVDRHKDIKILILEDDDIVSDFYYNAFSEYGYDCEIVRTGSEALAFLSRNNPKVAIVDIKLPDMTGVEFMTLARQKGYTGPAIAISGAMTEVNQERLADFAISMQKPIKAAELIRKVEDLIV